MASAGKPFAGGMVHTSRSLHLATSEAQQVRIEALTLVFAVLPWRARPQVAVVCKVESPLTETSPEFELLLLLQSLRSAAIDTPTDGRSGGA